MTIYGSGDRELTRRKDELQDWTIFLTLYPYVVAAAAAFFIIIFDNFDVKNLRHERRVAPDVSRLPKLLFCVGRLPETESK